MTQSLDVLFDPGLNKRLIKQWDAGDLRRHCAHYDVTVINTLRWRHNGRDSVSKHQPHDCSLNRLFRRRSKKTSKLRVTGLCAGNSPLTGEFPAQMASNAENVSIWWRRHDILPIGIQFQIESIMKSIKLTADIFILAIAMIWPVVHACEYADTNSFPYKCYNTLRPRQNGRHFPDDIFKWIFLNENIWI